MKHVLALALLFTLAACSDAPPPRANGGADDGGAAIASRTVVVGSEGASLAACPSVSRVIDGGTDVYWAPDELRAIKAKLPAGARVALCQATDDDRWFGVVFPAIGGDIDLCQIGKSVASPREYQGPCRWGWIKGGTVRLGS